jgi:hypothetical protein
MTIWKPLVCGLILATATACGNTAADSATELDVDSNSPEAAEPVSASSASPSKPAAAAPAARPDAAAPAPAPAPVVKRVTIPAGAAFDIILADSLNSGKNQAGDPFTGHLAEAIKVDGRAVIEKGAKVQGRIVDAEGSGRVKGLANMRLAVTSIEHRGRAVPITTASHFIEAKATKGRDAAIIGGGAGVGAVIGAIAGGKKGAATGGIIGGAAGTGTVLATKGEEVDLPAESRLSFSLEKELEVIP